MGRLRAAGGGHYRAAGRDTLLEPRVRDDVVRAQRRRRVSADGRLEDAAMGWACRGVLDLSVSATRLSRLAVVGAAPAIGYAVEHLRAANNGRTELCRR